MVIVDRLKHAWDAFQQREPPLDQLGPSSFSSNPPYMKQHYINSRRTMLSSIFNKIAVDAAMTRIEHIKQNEDGYYVETVKDGLNDILTLNANIDQCGKAFIRDIIISMFDEGVVAVVPTYATADPNLTESYDLICARVGKIVQWYRDSVRVEVFDEHTQMRRRILFKKSYVAIIENPFHEIMNEPNSTLQRLNNTLDNLDIYDRRQAAGKLDMLIQFPTPIRTDARRKEAEKRINGLEEQLRNSEFSIGYIDATEKIIPLGRSIENNLWSQAQDLTDQLFNQIGMPKSVFEGTATDEEKVSYYNNTISPVLAAIADEFTRKFLSKTAITQGHIVDYFQNFFKLIPVSKLAEIVDKFTRNEVLSPNEVRMELGYKPSEDPKANELRNRNLNNNSSVDPSDLPGMDELDLNETQNEERTTGDEETGL